jgi:hypothetical protein
MPTPATQCSAPCFTASIRTPSSPPVVTSTYLHGLDTPNVAAGTKLQLPDVSGLHRHRSSPAALMPSTPSAGRRRRRSAPLDRRTHTHSSSLTNTEEFFREQGNTRSILCRNYPAFSQLPLAIYAKQTTENEWLTDATDAANISPPQRSRHPTIRRPGPHLHDSSYA